MNIELMHNEVEQEHEEEIFMFETQEKCLNTSIM